jgi:hypothetical protein
MSLTFLRSLLPASRKYYRCDYDRSSSPSPVSIKPLTFFRNICPGPVLPRGAAVCTATSQTINAWTSLLYYLSIFAWTHGCSRNVYRFGRLGYNAAPHFAPGGREEKGARKQNKKNLVRYDHPRSKRYWLHSASRNRSPLPRP